MSSLACVHCKRELTRVVFSQAQVTNARTLMTRIGFLLLSVLCKHGLEYWAGEAWLTMRARVNGVLVYCLSF